MKKKLTVISILLAILTLSGCGGYYICDNCEKKTSKAYYTLDGDLNADLEHVLCEDCARDYWMPLPYENYRVKSGAKKSKKASEDSTIFSPENITDSTPETDNEEEYIATIIYDAAGGHGAPSSHTASIIDEVAEYRLSDQEPYREGYNFIGWRLENDSFYDIDSPGQSIAIQVGNNNCILIYYAQWE